MAKPASKATVMGVHAASPRVIPGAIVRFGLIIGLPVIALLFTIDLVIWLLH